MRGNILTKEEAIYTRVIDGVAILSSLRIAEVTGKLHRDVLKTIRRVFDDAGIDEGRFASTYLTGQNRVTKHYLLPEREFNLIVSGYSVKYRLQLIDELMIARRMIKEETIARTCNSSIKQLENKLAVTMDVAMTTKLIGNSIRLNGEVFDMDSLAKLASGKEQNVKLSRNNMFKILREMRLVEKKHTRPTQKGMNKYLDYRIRTRGNSNTYEVVAYAVKADELIREMIAFLSKHKAFNKDIGNPFNLKVTRAKRVAKKPAVEKPVVKKPAVKKPTVKKPVRRSPFAKSGKKDATKKK